MYKCEIILYELNFLDMKQCYTGPEFLYKYETALY